MVKVFISNFYVIDHTLYSKIKMPPISWHTILQLLGKILHTIHNGFLQQGSSDLLQCVHQLWNCCGYSMVFVAIASCKDVG